MHSNYTIAKYIRLSIEDAKSESMSIENQRLILDKYIANMENAPENVIEFVDNGHSGMNFERPSFQELLELVRQGQINCIIVKDLSRFGREMIDTGYYLERVFPLYRIRFIAVSDNFDSEDYEGSTGGLEIAFKHLIHEQYSLDLSRKVKAAKQAKALRGELLTKNCVFGYKKVGKNLEIDENEAETIRYIFRMSADGLGLSEISKRLYDEKYPTPSEYRKSHKNTKKPGIPCLWNKMQLLSILSNEQYIGTYIAGKTRKIEVGGAKYVRIPKSEWFRISNHHPAIISNELFDAVQERRTQKVKPLRKREMDTSTRYRDITSPLKGRVICGCCGRNMVLSQSKNTAFHCAFTKPASDMDCHMLRKPAVELESEVLSEIHEKVRGIIAVSQVESNKAIPSAEESQSLARLNEAKLALYESLALSEIDAEVYKERSVEIDMELQKLTGNYGSNSITSVGKSDYIGLQQNAMDALNEDSLTEETVDAFIGNVKVYPGGCIEVVWK